MTHSGDQRHDEAAKAAQLCIEYDPQPPYDAGAPSKAGTAVIERARATVKDILDKTLAGARKREGRAPRRPPPGSG